MRGRQPGRVHGFTLLEVLVALAVLAIALAALIKGIAGNMANAAQLRDMSMAHWVGMNVVAESRLIGSWKNGSEVRGEEEMGNHTWYWRARLVDTFDEDVRRLEVDVWGSEDRDVSPLVSLVAFMSRPQQVTP